MSLLKKIVAEKEHVHTLRDPIADWEQRTSVADLPPALSFVSALRASGSRPAAIAEFKRRSPSAGEIRAGADPQAIAREYAAAGAEALSVLSDEKFFGGRLADVTAARVAGLPILRKDFTMFPEDLVDARHAGASCVLLIARILDDTRLAALLADARSLGLESLVEVHDEREWERALAAGASLVGINHRDLDTLGIDLELSARLAAKRPAGDAITLVAESGLRTAEDVARVRDAGIDAILVGEALLREESPGAALRRLRGMA